MTLGEGVGVSASLGEGEALCRFFAEGVADSSGVGVGEVFLRCLGDGDGLGEGFRFGFAFSEGLASAGPGRAEARPSDNVGDADTIFFSVEGASDSSDVGVGEGFLRGVGDSDGLDEAFGFGLADGVGVGDEAFFFVDVFL